MLTGFCERNGLLITNTRLKNPKRRMYIWKEPGDHNQHKLNYVLVKKFRKSVTDVQTLPGADNDLLVAIISNRQ
jgi:hypothetical protein